MRQQVPPHVANVVVKIIHRINPGVHHMLGDCYLLRCSETASAARSLTAHLQDSLPSLVPPTQPSTRRLHMFSSSLCLRMKLGPRSNSSPTNVWSSAFAPS